MQYLLLIIGLILIILASDLLIDSAKSIAIRLKIPKVLIALTVVAFGTCTPELAISFKSVMEGNGSISLANVVGSLIVNILLIIGIASISNPIRVKNITIKKELPILLMITFVFFIIISNGIINPYKHKMLNRFDGLILLFLFSVFMVYIVNMVKQKDKGISDEKPKFGIIKSIFYLMITILVISWSSDLLFNNAVKIAGDLGVSEKVITMVIIVIGTSLPELFLAVTSARKKEYEMVIGNIIGTNIFNICVVMGLPVTIYNGFHIIDFNLIDIIVVLFAALLLFYFARSEKTLSRNDGFIMIFIFIIYYGYVLFI